MLINDKGTASEYSFWADSKDQQYDIFLNFLDVIMACKDYVIYHYGQFERKYLKRMIKKLNESGNELFPDVSVSWFPNIDVRHSSTRNLGLKNPGIFLNEFSIVCELKVTGSTSKPTQPRQILNDIAKLYLFSAAHKKSSELVTDPYPLQCYMIILDNAKNVAREKRVLIYRRTSSSQ
jgi:hypothetical protein